MLQEDTATTRLKLKNLLMLFILLAITGFLTTFIFQVPSKFWATVSCCILVGSCILAVFTGFSIRSPSNANVKIISFVFLLALYILWMMFALLDFHGHLPWACVGALAMLPSSPTLSNSRIGLDKTILFISSMSIVLVGFCHINKYAIPVETHGIELEERYVKLGNFLVMLCYSLSEYSGMRVLLKIRQRLDDLIQIRQDLFAKVSHDAKQPVHALMLMCELTETKIASYTKLADPKSSSTVGSKAFDKSDCISSSSTASVQLPLQVLRESSRNLSGMMKLLDTLKSLMNDFVMFSTFENNPSNTWTVYPKPVKLSQICERVAIIFDQSADIKGLTFELQCPQSLLDLVVVADATRLAQVLVNLCGNALNYTSKGGFKLAVSLQDQSYEHPTALNPKGKPADVHVKFEVQDTGRGMTEVECARVFRPYVRENHSENAHGSGLGLSVCKSLVKLMEGTISVRSTLGVGSTFSVVVPLCLGELPNSSVDAKQDSISVHLPRKAETSGDLKGPDSLQACLPQSERRESLGSSGTPPPIRILLVEDSLVVQKVFARSMETHFGLHVEVTTADNGVSGLFAFKASLGLPRWFDIIFVDKFMPDMGGVEFAKEVSKLQLLLPADQRVPVLGMTGSNPVEAGEWEVEGFITKPFAVKDIFKLLKARLPPNRTEQLVLELPH